MGVLISVVAIATTIFWFWFSTRKDSELRKMGVKLGKLDETEEEHELENVRG